MQPISNFFTFVRQSPTAFQAVQTIAQNLEEKGFQRLPEHRPWQLAPGGKYFVTRNRSAVIAFSLPEDGLTHFQIVASHGDSPTFKLKPLCEDAVCGQYLRLNVERYGGMIMSAWFDRPLSIAGRVVVRSGGRLETRLVDLDRDAALIPNMPIHFNRQVNDGYTYNAQTDLPPLYAQGGDSGRLMAEVAACAGVQPEEIAAADLFLYNRMAGSVWGPEGEFFSCPRIDDLECAWTALNAFADAPAHGHGNVYAVLDNEEVGSGTKQGADSTFLGDVLGRVCAALGQSEAQMRAAVAQSFMVSADNAHAVHPNHPEQYDAQNRAFMNRGVVIKHNASQKYTTDAVSCAVFAEICRGAGVPVQHFANRSDMPGGSTLGNIANAHASMNTVDIGLAQLAMHSSYETAGTRDAAYMTDALSAFYRANIQTLADGDLRIG